MTTIRKHYSPTFKSEVAQEALKGDKTINQIATQYRVHPNVIGKWKRAALKAMPAAFDDDESGRTQAHIDFLKAEHEREKEQLYAEIGKLTTQLNWLKKKCDTGLAQAAQSRTSRAGQ